MTQHLTEHEKMIITKYDLYFESRLSKNEASIDVLKDNIKEIKIDLRWLIGLSFTAWITLLGVMSKGFGWI